MEDVDARPASRGSGARPSTRSLQGTPRTPPRTPPTQSKPDASSMPKARGSASGRPPSAGISAWEDDGNHTGEDLIAYVGKADSLSSGATTPRNPTGPITGDGNLAQALLAARKAAEIERRSSAGISSAASSSGSEDAPERRHSQQPPPDGSDDGGSGSGMNGGVRQGPGRLSRASGCNEESDAAADGGQAERVQGPEQPTPNSVAGAELLGAETGAVGERAEAGEEAGDEGQEAGEGKEPEAVTAEATNASVAPSHAAGEDSIPEAGRQDGAKDLRGLLYSDDGGGDDDEDYQDLMTADDEALFGSLGAGGGGSAVGNNGSASPGTARGNGRSNGDKDGVVKGTEGGEAAVSGPAADAQTGGDAPADAAVRRNSLIAVLGGGEGAHGGATASPPPSAEGSVLPGTKTAWGGNGRVSPEAQVATQAPVAAGKVAAHLVVFSSGLPGQDGLPVQFAGPRGVVMAPADVAATTQMGLGSGSNPGAFKRVSDASATDLRVNQLHNNYQQAQHAGIPTAQVGEGLRQHPPISRRTYTPGQNNRSPVRGSGYVVSPAAVRPPSPTAPGWSSHHAAPPGGGRQASSPNFAPMTVTATGLSGAPRELRASAGSGAATAAAAPTYDGEVVASGPPELNNVTVINFGFTGSAGVAAASAAQHGGTAAPFSSPGVGGGIAGSAVGSGGSFMVGSWSGIASGPGAASAGGAGPAVMASSGPFGRFPPAAVQHFGGGQVYRSMPISQVAGSPSDEMLGSGGQAAGRGSNRLSARAGRQPRPAALGPLGQLRDRYGSTSAPARHTTSPVRSPRGTSGSSRTAKPALAGVGPLAAAPATAVFGNGVLTSHLSDGVDGLTAGAAASQSSCVVPGTGAPLRSLAVPSFPQYGAPMGIRHCGFKQSPSGMVSGGGGGGGAQAAALYGGGAVAGGGGAAGLYGSSFSGSRQKANDERMRSAMLAKVIASVAAKEQQQQHFAGAGQHEFSVLHASSQPPSPHGSGADTGFAPTVSFDSSVANGLPSSGTPRSSDPPSQVPRRSSLPHLLAASYQQGDHAPGSNPAGYTSHSHGPSHLTPHHPHTAAQGPALLGRGAGSRNALSYDNGLPAVAQSQLVPGVRSFSFDVSRRGVSRA